MLTNEYFTNEIKVNERPFSSSMLLRNIFENNWYLTPKYTIIQIMIMRDMPEFRGWLFHHLEVESNNIDQYKFVI